MPQESSDQTMLDLLRSGSSLTIAELAEQTGVTATAVRQRLSRLTAEGLVERQLERQPRGRPSHRYSLTEKGLRSSGTNYDDLSLALWHEVRSIQDTEIRRGLLRRIAAFLSQRYAKQVTGKTLSERMQSLQNVMDERDVLLKVNESGELPILSAMACPYPGLAEVDRSVCAMEKMMFSEVLGTNLRLTECRLDGDHCCTFEASPRDGMLVDSA